MGSVIKKRRKRMSKKKHRKLLRKTRHQRRNKKSIDFFRPALRMERRGLCGPPVFAGWVLSARFFASGFVFVEGMCGSPVWGAARYLRDWDYD